jgi:hypothetical protein
VEEVVVAILIRCHCQPLEVEEVVVAILIRCHHNDDDDDDGGDDDEFHLAKAGEVVKMAPVVQED